MATLETLLIKVGVDASGVDRQAQGITKSMSRVGRTMTATVTPALIGLGVVATNAASNLEESINAVEVVFGSASDTIRDFGKTSESTVGLSTRAFNELVVPVGAALQNVGFSADEAADSSIALAERAADMASVFNVDVNDALMAVQAGLRGEAEPLERFGVGLSAAAVEAKAMELGLADSRGELDENAKAQARLALFMDQTDAIAGDFANTAGSVANQERIAAAEAENMAASFGEQLLPIKQQLISVVRTLLSAFNNLSPGMQRIILMAAGVTAALGPILLVAAQVIKIGGSLVKSFVAVGKAFLVLSKILLANPWVLVAAAIIALVVVVVKNWDTIKSVISTAWEAIKKVTVIVWNAIKSVVEAVIGFLVKLFLNFTGPGLIIKHWDTIKSATSSAWNAVKDFVSNAIRTIQSILSSAWRAIVSAARAGWNRVIDVVRGVPNRIISSIGSLIRSVKSFFSRVWSGALSAVRSGVFDVLRAFREIPRRIRSAIPNPFDLLRNIGRSIISGLLSGIRSAVGGVFSFVGGLADRIRSLKGPEREDRKLLVREGEAIMFGLGRGIEAGMPRLRGLLSDVTDEISTGVDVATSTRVAVPRATEQRVVWDLTGADEEMKKIIRKMARASGLEIEEAA